MNFHLWPLTAATTLYLMTLRSSQMAISNKTSKKDHRTDTMAGSESPEYLRVHQPKVATRPRKPELDYSNNSTDCSTLGHLVMMRIEASSMKSCSRTWKHKMHGYSKVSWVATKAWKLIVRWCTTQWKRIVELQGMTALSPEKEEELSTVPRLKELLSPMIGADYQN